MDLDMFQGGSIGSSQTRRHFIPQIRHHSDARHYTTTPQTPPLQPWVDTGSQHDRTAPTSRCRHGLGNGQVRYAQAIKDALLLLGAQSMHGGSTCYDCPEFPLPHHLDFDAGSCATAGDTYSTGALEDYDFTNPFSFLDMEPSYSQDINMDEFYTISTPSQPSPTSCLLPDGATTTDPIPTPPPSQPESPPSPSRPEICPPSSTAATNKSRKRPNPNSTPADDVAISPLPSSSSPKSTPASSGVFQSGSPPGEGPKKERPHAAVEKRYRVSLNDKIEALRVCLESRKRPKRNNSQQQPLQCPSPEDGGPTPAASTTATTTTTTNGPSVRMSKAEVLAEAVEYVQQLEEENGVMLEQIEDLVKRMQATQRALQLPSFTAGRNG